MSTLALQALECPNGHGVRKWVQYAPRFDCTVCDSTIDAAELATWLMEKRGLDRKTAQTLASEI